jgi:hypothetical protein
VEVDLLTVWATERQHLSDSKFILSGFQFRKLSSPRFFSGGSSTEGPPPGLSVFILFVLIIVILGRLAWGCGLDSTVSGQGPVAGWCECGDEPSGSCATELVIVTMRDFDWSVFDSCFRLLLTLAC